MITCGIDVGARTTKAVVLADGRVAAEAIEDTGGAPAATARQVFQAALRQAGVAAARGDGRHRLRPARPRLRPRHRDRDHLPGPRRAAPRPGPRHPGRGRPGQQGHRPGRRGPRPRFPDERPVRRRHGAVPGGHGGRLRPRAGRRRAAGPGRRRAAGHFEHLHGLRRVRGRQPPGGRPLHRVHPGRRPCGRGPAPQGHGRPPGHGRAGRLHGGRRSQSGRRRGPAAGAGAGGHRPGRPADDRRPGRGPGGGRPAEMMTAFSPR